MIEPRTCIRYDLDTPRLEEFLLFCASVAGKNAHTTARCLDRALREVHARAYGHPSTRYPFAALRRFAAAGGELSPVLRASGLGCFNQRARTFSALASSGLDLRRCAPADLERVPGIGMKTSRYFLLFTRPGVDDLAPVDTHALKRLKAEGYRVRLGPIGSRRRYLRYERWYVRTWRRHGGGMSLAEFDLDNWLRYAVLPRAAA